MNTVNEFLLAIVTEEPIPMDHICILPLDVLESSGLSVWVDETELSPGSPYLREIGEAIVDSSVFLTLLSQDSVQSKYCQVSVK